MKLIINTVNLKIGGAFQRSISFLKELKEIGKDDYHVFYNENIGKQIDVNGFPYNFKFYFFKQTPASLKFRKEIIKRFNTIENKVQPDVVFSFVGPCYWRAKSPHLVGFGVPHIVYDDYKYVKKSSLKIKLEMFYKKYWTKKEADFYVVQTQDVAERLAKKINVDSAKIYLVSNGIGAQYKGVKVKAPDNKGVKKLLMISTFRPSKNFEIINKVIPYLQNDFFNYEFHITIKQEDYERVFKGKEQWVKNHGHVLTKDCPQLYNDCDAMFLPAHLECFSASYPEAMKMERPILTSNLSFAKTVCEDSALYFDNLNAKDVSEKIINLFHDKDLYNSLVKKGKERLEIFDDSRGQAEKYIKICQEIARNKS
ncbi:MAG: glycosyltransferase [Polaribacter sp.]|uniref:glycosyltransferase family 4 protein n=1 Tax=Polaribacter sp. TaxID=1920175 RepID=UPI002F359977